jgi:hypothetical protein
MARIDLATIRRQYPVTRLSKLTSSYTRQNRSINDHPLWRKPPVVCVPGLPAEVPSSVRELAYRLSALP